MKRMMNVYETASFVGVGVATIYEMVRANEIPHTRVRSRILFHPEVIDNWLRGDAGEITHTDV